MSDVDFQLHRDAAMHNGSTCHRPAPVNMMRVERDALALPLKLVGCNPARLLIIGSGDLHAVTAQRSRGCASDR
jgi:hypothetical protein